MNARFPLVIAFALAALPAVGQTKTPAPAAAPAAAATAAERAQPDRAQRETVSALLNAKKVSIEYGRPSLRGRTVDALLSQLGADHIWRAGMDQVTTLTAESDVMIGGTLIPAGKYSVYLHAPASGAYSLVLNKDLGVPLKTIFAQAPPALANEPWPRLGGDYATVVAQEVARIPLVSVAPREPMDRFNVGFDPAVDGRSALTLTWGDRAWTVPVTAVGATR